MAKWLRRLNDFLRRLYQCQKAIREMIMPMVRMGSK